MKMNKMEYIEIAKRVFAIEAQAVAQLSARLDNGFVDAVERILLSRGRVIVCGMGKSGIIGKKIAATLASTGTPSFFMHPGEAYHGDLGMVTPDDVFIAISNSGETDEVVKLLPFLKENGNFLITLTGNVSSTLAIVANSHLDIGVAEEACPLQLAPTSSTTAALAMGDALAVTLMHVRGFNPENFARFHPGGSLGRRLLGKVRDQLQTNFPTIDDSAVVLDVLKAMSKGGVGLTLVRHSKGIGLITDGDLRRGLEAFKDKIFEIRASQLMSETPRTIDVDTRIDVALDLMDSKNISSLIVTENNEIIGVFKK